MCSHGILPTLLCQHQPVLVLVGIRARHNLESTLLFHYRDIFCWFILEHILKIVFVSIPLNMDALLQACLFVLANKLIQIHMSYDLIEQSGYRPLKITAFYNRLTLQSPLGRTHSFWTACTLGRLMSYGLCWFMSYTQKFS